MTRTPTIQTELGIERLCRGCGSFWPFNEDDADEFWYFHRDRNGKRRVQSRCRACWSERKVVDGRRTWRVATNGAEPGAPSDVSLIPSR